MKTHLAAVAIATLLCACNPPPAATGPTNAPAASEQAASLAVVNWGQRSTKAGVPFNVQADGNSGIWFELNQALPVQFTASFDGKPLTGVVASGVLVTATIPAEYLATAGIYPVTLEVPARVTRLVAGDFEVESP